MPKTEKRVTKGFGFYLLMLILMLFAAFMIIVCIMMFSPKKVILGYQYFVYGGEEVLVATTDNETPINFADTEEIIVNCHNAKVSIIKSDKLDKDNIVIVHNTNGFAKWSDNVEMTYSVVYSGKKLVINVNEPQGFLHLSSDLQVIVRLTNKSEYDFANTKFNITTTSGGVVVGNSTQIDKKDVNLDINNLSITTDGGNINLTKFNNADFENVFVNTNYGSFTNNLEAMNVSQSMKLNTASGTINLNNFTFKDGDKVDNSKILELSLGNGRFNAKTLTGSLSFISQSGQIKIDKLTGNFDGNDTSEKIDRTEINIAEVNGSVSLPSVKASNVNIGRIGGQVNIETTTGNINIGSESKGLEGASWLKSESGNITANVCDKLAGGKHYFSTNSGKIDLTYTTLITSQNQIEAITGEVDINFGSSNKFLLTLKDSTGKLFESLNEKLNLPFVTSENFDNPLKVNGYTGNSYFIEILTDGIIKANLI